MSTVPLNLGPNFLRAIKDTARALQKSKKVDPRDRYVLLYPSAESAHVGMGLKLLNTKPAEEIFEQASQFTKRDILRLCLEGPGNELLDSMESRHIATYVTSHATMSKLGHERPEIPALCKAAGGIGVGFVNCLVFSGAMSFENGLDLVQRQGRAMDKVVKTIPTARLKVRLAPATSKVRVCHAAMEHCLKLGIPQEIAVCAVSKQTHAYILEFAGHEEAIKYLETEGMRLFKFRLAARVQRVPFAINTPVMRPVSEYLRLYIEQRCREDPDYLKDPETCSVYTATTGIRIRAAKNIKKDLIRHPSESLKVEQLLHCLFRRPRGLAQPNIIVLWDKSLLKNLGYVNRLAFDSAELYA